MNTVCAADLMRGRAVAAVCADEDRRAYFPSKIFQKHRKQNNRARNVVRKLAQKQVRFAAIHQHQLREREVRSEADLVRLLPAVNFIKKTRATMHVPTRICFCCTW